MDDFYYHKRVFSQICKIHCLLPAAWVNIGHALLKANILHSYKKVKLAKEKQIISENLGFLKLTFLTN